MHTKLLTVGLVLCAINVPVFGQGYPQQTYRIAQVNAGTPGAATSAIRVIQPSTSTPQPTPMNAQAPMPALTPMPAPVPVPEQMSVLEPGGSDESLSVDFDAILSDQDAVGCGCPSPGCQPACVPCQDGCDQSCCLDAFFGRDPCVPVPAVGVDPLGGCGFESMYRAPVHSRGLWANYPAEKHRETMQLLRSRVPPAPPCCNNGPILHRPRCVVQPEPVAACPQPDECCTTGDMTDASRQARAVRPALAR